MFKYANFTAEGCTGTGATLELTTPITGHIAFSKSFADGDHLRYVVEDSGGTIKVAGIGTYVAATNDIIRNDTWNWNGTVVDENPTTNITLSGGTHTIRCQITAKDLAQLTNGRTSTTTIYNGILNSHGGGGYGVIAANYQHAYLFQLNETALISNVKIKVNTADASGLAEIGLSRCVDGISASSYIASGTLDITSVGDKTLTVNKILEAGYYFVHIVLDSATAQFAISKQIDQVGVGWTPLREIPFTDRNSPTFGLDVAKTLGTLVADPSTVTGNNSKGGADKIVTIRMTRG